jgi:hypothetical protein
VGQASWPVIPNANPTGQEALSHNPAVFKVTRLFNPASAGGPADL